MHEWEKALHTFLLDWKDRKDVIGAVLTGSYANGTQSKFSDIDVHIILSDKVKWRERGNRYVDGRLIEYFANSLKQNEKYQMKDFSEQSFGNPRMFTMGKILFDKTGEIRTHKEKCKRFLGKRFPKLSRFDIESRKYELWDGMDTLTDLFEHHSPNFQLVYPMVLSTIIQSFCAFHQMEPFPPYKWHKLLTHEKYRKKYHYRALSKTFNSLFLTAVQAHTSKQKLTAAKALVDFLHHQMGGFSIDGWKLRSKAEK